MSTSIPNCFVCDATTFMPLFVKKGRQFWQCRGCGLQKQHPLPSPETLAEYYDQSYQSGLYEEFVVAASLKDVTAQQRLREIRGHVPFDGRWLDVGASTGNFCDAARSMGIDAEGVELSETAAKVGHERGVPMHVGLLDSIDPSCPYDCITALDVIEHVPDPPSLIRQIRARLVDGGYLVLTLPNLRVLQRYVMGSRWYFYIPEEHLHFFTPKIMTRFLERHGMEVMKIKSARKPMTFNYAQTQFKEYNPLIYRVLSVFGAVTPNALREYPMPLPIGEMCVIARKRS